MSERDDVIRWLTTIIGWRFVRVDEKPKGRSVYVFHEPDTGGWWTERVFRADQLRWRYVSRIGFQYVPELRDGYAALWQGYLSRLPEAMLMEAPE